MFLVSVLLHHEQQIALMLNDNVVCRTNVPIENFLDDFQRISSRKVYEMCRHYLGVGSECIDLPRSVRGSDAGATFIPQGHSTQRAHTFSYSVSVTNSGTSTISERAWWSSCSVESTPKLDTGLPSGYSPVLAYLVICSCLRKGNHKYHDFIVIRNGGYYNTSSVATIKFTYKYILVTYTYDTKVIVK